MKAGSSSVENTGYFIVGTAGHIDHGKTSLVKALTGIDTDFYKEEKERGISIDLGFAPLILPSQRKVGIVDVPGHERFIKNMVAGASGIDLILLIIDSNEGIMPQTIEHLRILELLQVQQGIVVLTKADTVDSDWSALVEEEVRAGLKGTFLEQAPLCHVSAVTRSGLDTLLQEIDRLAGEMESRDTKAPFRMPVDRVFSVPGFGTVVTGTISRGILRVGDPYELLPSKKQVRVRSLQVHGEQVNEAIAGQRAAVNLTGVVRSEVNRGDVLAIPELYEPTSLLDIRVTALPEARPLKNRMRIRFYTGTVEAMGRLILLDRLELAPGEEAIAQLELETPVVCDRGDRFILRLFSPMVTLGGGGVIDPHPIRKHRRNKEDIIQELLLRETGGPEQRFCELVDGEVGISLADAAVRLKMTEVEVETLVKQLMQSGQLTHPAAPLGYLTAERLNELLDEVEEALLANYGKQPLVLFVPKSQLQAQMRTVLKPRAFAALLQIGLEQQRFLVKGEKVKLASYEATLSLKQKQGLTLLLDALKKGGLQPPSAAELSASLKGFDRMVPNLIQYAEEMGHIVRVADGMYFETAEWQKALQAAERLGKSEEGFTAADFRDALGTSRKYAIALLEQFDDQGYTVRKDDRRRWDSKMSQSVHPLVT